MFKLQSEIIFFGLDTTNSNSMLVWWILVIIIFLSLFYRFYSHYQK